MKPTATAAAVLACMACTTAPALADDAPVLALSAEYVADATVVAQGPRTGTRYTDLLDVAADLSLEQTLGWHGARLVLHGQAMAGGEPNKLAGTLQGINNSEVTDNRARLFEAYVEQAFAGPLPGSLRLGFSDLNAEFYANEPAGLLIAPAFGIGSELSATGPNGPSIFPSTALGARLRVEPGHGIYVQAAALDAKAGVPGDAGGVPPLFRNGLLLISEAGIASGDGPRVAIGAWRYTHRQDDLVRTDAAGDPLRRRAAGAYLLTEAPLGKGVTGFLRAGLSDGRTSPYKGGWQAGFLATGVFPGRPDGQLSFGMDQGLLGHAFRSGMRAAGEPLRHAETGFELTYADTLAPWLTVQPDVQYVRTTARTAGSRDAVVLTLRLRLAWSNSD